MTAPLYWFTAVRPLSDSSGLAAALAVQAMTLAAAQRARRSPSPRFCAGLAAGLRSQVRVADGAAAGAAGAWLRARASGRGDAPRP